MRFKKILCLSILIVTSLVNTAFTSGIRERMINSPASYLEIPQWSVYSAWGGIAIIHNVKIINKSDIEYSNIKIRIVYTSSTAGSPGTVISQETGVLPVTVPPHSSGLYLREGVTLGSNSQFMNPLRIEILGADHNP